jgi:HD-like signal output (HDOD) protein/CheY-like chemotaxis protein
MKKILFVDNEPAVLDGLRRSLYRMRGAWDMHFSGDHAGASELLAAGGIDVLVTDICAPGGIGLDFIREVSRRWPEVIRIALSTDIQGETAIESLGVTHQLLSKPADIETIRTAVHRATRLHELLGTQGVGNVIKKLQHIPSLPDAYRRLTAIIGDEHADLSGVAAVIETDPGLTSGIMKIINSAYFGLQREICDVAEAVTYIGVDTLKGIVLNDKLFESLVLDASCRRGASDLVRHGLAAATTARRFGAALGFTRAQQGDLYMTGLIHDFGKLVLLSAFGTAYFELLRNADPEQDTSRLEREHYSVDHATVAAYLFAIWGLPDDTVSVVANHHQADAWIQTESLAQGVLFAALALSQGGDYFESGAAAYALMLEESGSALATQLAPALTGRATRPELSHE